MSSRGGTPGLVPSPSTRTTIAISVLGVLTALLATATGFLGYQTAVISKEKEEAQRSLANSDSDASSLQGQVDQLKAENSQLRSQLGAPTAEPATPSAPSVRHSGQINVGQLAHVDLDSPSSDPQWETGDDEFHEQGGFYLSSRTRVLFLGNTKADYDTCRTTSGYENPTLVSPLEIGTYYCFETTDKRYSAVKILDTNPKLVIDVVTYDPPNV